MYTQVSVLSRACSDFLISTLDISNCLSLSALAEGYGSSSLQQKANEFVVQNFQSFSLTQDFLEIQVLFLFKKKQMRCYGARVVVGARVMDSQPKGTGFDLQVALPHPAP